MVDTLALGASGSDPMEVQVLSSAPIDTRPPIIQPVVYVFSLPAYAYHIPIGISSPVKQVSEEHHGIQMPRIT